MRRPITIRFFLLILLLILVFPLSVAVAQKAVKKSGCTVLTSCSKFALASNKKSDEVAVTGKGEIVRLAGVKRYKSRPVRHSRRFSSTVLKRRLSSRSVIVMNAETGDVLYSRNPDAPRQPASTIKVLTGLIAINSLGRTTPVPVSRRASAMPRSKIYLERGKSYAANDLINAVLLASANDASVALAEKIGGSEHTFARLMTQKARSFGARNTVCKTATGLTARGQKSTARDLALIFNNAMDDPGFARRMAYVKVKTTGGMVLRNHNRALWEVTGAEGGKTGFTNAARQTYVGKFRRDGEELLVAIMGSETMWSDIDLLVEYGFYKEKKMAQATASLTKQETPSLAVNLTPSKTFVSFQLLSDCKKFSQL